MIEEVAHEIAAMPGLIRALDLKGTLVTADAGPEGAKTTTEMAAEVGRPVVAIHRALQRLAAEGRLVTHRVQRPTISGAMARVPAYTILPKPAPKRARRGK